MDLTLGEVRIIPAYAGSTAKQALNTVYGKGSSPHTRGALANTGLGVVGNRIIPAYAGSTPGGA